MNGLKGTRCSQDADLLLIGPMDTEGKPLMYELVHLYLHIKYINKQQCRGEIGGQRGT